jgi:hypothetical protein
MQGKDRPVCVGGNTVCGIRKRPAVIFKAAFRVFLGVYAISKYYVSFLAASFNNPVSGLIVPRLDLRTSGALKG